jgi:hypothetical protein
MSDLDAGQRLGCRTYLVGTGERAAVVERRAAERGIVLHGIASSLVDLVADDPALREILTRRQTA